MFRRTSLTLLAAAGLIAAGLVGATPAAHAAAPFGGPWCANNGNTAPCVGDVTLKDGNNPPETIDSSSDDYSVSIDDCTGGCDGSVGWSVNNFSGPLDPSMTWTIDINIGDSMVPTSTDTWGTGVTIDRPTGSGTVVTIKGNPTLIDDASGCTSGPDLTFNCIEQAAVSSTDFFGFIDDLHPDNTQEIADAAYGTDTWTNAGNTGAPEYDGPDGNQHIEIPIGNTHNHADGTVSKGVYQAFVPNGSLRLFGIDDPSTLTSDGLSIGIQSGDVTITPTDSGVYIDIANIIWPDASTAHARQHFAGKKKRAKVTPLKIKRGVITPTRPSKVVAKRKGSDKAVLIVKGAKPQGSHITSYSAKCAGHHTADVSAKSKHHKLKIKGLASGATYSCQARAVSKAGHGKWSKGVKLGA